MSEEVGGRVPHKTRGREFARKQGEASTGLSPKMMVEKPRKSKLSPEMNPAPCPNSAVATRPPSSLPMGRSCSALTSAPVNPMRASG